MAIDAVTTEPTTIRAGDTLSWLISVSDYTAPTWTLKYKLVNSAAVIALTSVASGVDHAVTATAAVTVLYTAGTYKLVKFVEAGTGASLERVTLSESTIEVLPSLTTATAATDTRTWNEKMLDALRTAALSTSAILHGKVTVDGKSVEFRDSAELDRRIALFEQRVASEQAAAAETATAGIYDVPFSFGGWN